MTFRKIAGLAVVASILFAGPAMAAGSPPSVPTGVYMPAVFTTKTTLGLSVRSACDPDGDFGVGVGGYFEFQLNGVTYSTGVTPQQPNCVTDTSQAFGIIYGYGIKPPLTCGTGYTIRVRAVDLAGHHGDWATITGSQGAKTLPC